MIEFPERDHTPKLAVQLRQHIIDGRYAPGERLSEKALTEELGVSRNTLRESFQALAEQRLVTRIPHRGVSVSAPSVADVVDIYRARQILEVGALANATAFHPATTHMRKTIGEAQDAVDQQRWDALGTANMHFHLALIHHSDSPRITDAFGNLIAELRLAFLRLNDPQRLHQPFLERNDRMVTALENGDRHEAIDELKQYLDDSQRLLLSSYTRLGFD